MRAGIRLFVAAGVVLSLATASAAFNHGTASARSITVTLSGDSAAYVAIAATSGGAHACFVSESGSTGKVSLNFNASCGAGYGTGLGQGDGSTSTRYSRAAFHDILTITDKGDRAVDVWVNASTSSGGSSLIDVCTATSTGTMLDSCYSTFTSAARAHLSIGGSMYVGVRVSTGTLSSSAYVVGTISVDARATA